MRSFVEFTLLLFLGLDYISEGTAEVYSRWKDAEAAVKRYYHVELDGMPMKVEIVGGNLAVPSFVHLPTDVHKTQNAAPRRYRGSMGRPRENAYRRISPHRRSRVEEKISAEALDAELDKYHAEAKQSTK